MNNDRDYITKEDHEREMNRLSDEMHRYYATKADLYKAVIWAVPVVASLATSAAVFIERLIS